MHPNNQNVMEVGWTGVGVFGNVVAGKVDCGGWVQQVHRGSFPSLGSFGLTKTQGENRGVVPRMPSLSSSFHGCWNISDNFQGLAVDNLGGELN